MLSRESAFRLVERYVSGIDGEAFEGLVKPAWELTAVDDDADATVRIGEHRDRVVPRDISVHPGASEVLLATVELAALEPLESSWQTPPLVRRRTTLGIYAEVTDSSYEPVEGRVVEVKPHLAPDRDLSAPQLFGGPVAASASATLTIPEYEQFVEIAGDIGYEDWSQLREELRAGLGDPDQSASPDRVQLEAEIEALPSGPEQNELIYQYSLLGLAEEGKIDAPWAQLLGAPRSVEIDVREFGCVLHPANEDPAAWSPLFSFQDGFGGLEMPLGGAIHVLVSTADLRNGTFDTVVVGFEIS